MQTELPNGLEAGVQTATRLSRADLNRFLHEYNGSRFNFYNVKGQPIIFHEEDVHIVRLDKLLVDYLLELNTHNRNAKELVVRRYADEISRGNWRRTNQGIGVTKKGVLVDGQHRLMAVAAAGYPPVKIELSTGLDEDAQALVDVHTRRTQVDVLKLLLNHTVTSQMTAAVNAWFTIQEGDNGFTSNSYNVPSNNQLADFLQERGDFVHELIRACGVTVPAPVTGALLALGVQGYQEKAIEIGTKLKEGLYPAGTCPLYRLNRKIVDMKGKCSRPERLHLYKCAVTACVAYIRGEKLQILRESTTWGRLPNSR